MGLMGLNKGKRGEREVVKLLQPVIDKQYKLLGLVSPELNRNLMQAKSGGHDLVGLDWLSLEVKYQEQNNVNQWWEQTTRQADQSGGIPVLFYRKNHVKWRVRMKADVCADEFEHVPLIVDIAVDDFLRWFECKLLLEGKKEVGL